MGSQANIVCGNSMWKQEKFSPGTECEFQLRIGLRNETRVRPSLPHTLTWSCYIWQILQNHSKSLIVYHLASRESYFTIFTKLPQIDYPNPALHHLGPKKSTRNLPWQSPGKYFPVFTLDPHRSCKD